MDKFIKQNITDVMAIVITSVIFCFSTASCSSNQDNPETKVLLIEIDDAVQITNNFNPIDTIILHSDNYNLPGEVMSCKIVNDTIYISDGAKAHGLFIFDKSGKECGSINSVGGGPNEVFDFDDFDVTSDSIYVLDTEGRKIVLYSKNLIPEQSHSIYCRLHQIS